MRWFSFAIGGAYFAPMTCETQSLGEVVLERAVVQDMSRLHAQLTTSKL